MVDRYKNPIFEGQTVTFLKPYTHKLGEGTIIKIYNKSVEIEYQTTANAYNYDTGRHYKATVSRTVTRNGNDVILVTCDIKLLG